MQLAAPILRFLRLLSKPLLKYGPVILMTLMRFAKEIFSNKKLMQWLPVVVLIFFGFYWFYSRDEKLLIEDIRKSGSPAKEALLISKYLGTHKDSRWYDLSTYIEDEQAVLDLLGSTDSDIKLIETEYNKISRSGDFGADMHRFLSAEQLNLYYYLLGDG